LDIKHKEEVFSNFLQVAQLAKNYPSLQNVSSCLLVSKKIEGLNPLYMLVINFAKITGQL
jgi:hypothetical protein